MGGDRRSGRRTAPRFVHDVATRRRGRAVGRKVTEEATEVLLAAKDNAVGTGDRVAEEAADLVYHLLVLLAERNVPPSAVLQELANRRA